MFYYFSLIKMTNRSIVYILPSLNIVPFAFVYLSVIFQALFFSMRVCKLFMYLIL